VTGCTKVSAGCAHCYAERMSRRLAGRHGYPEAPHHFDVTLRPDRLEQPRHWLKSRRVFVVSMGDLFHDGVPLEYVARVWQIMRSTPWHTYQVLTKRPGRMLQFLNQCDEWEGWITNDGMPPKGYGGGPTGIVVGDTDHWPLPNVWLGVTAENQTTADERILLLLQCLAAVRLVSCEPLLSEIDLNEYLHCGISWCIIGAESGPGARPMDGNWVRRLIAQCKQYQVPVFYKQMIVGRKKIPLPMLDGRQYIEFPLTTHRPNAK